MSGTTTGLGRSLDFVVAGTGNDVGAAAVAAAIDDNVSTPAVRNVEVLRKNVCLAIRADLSSGMHVPGEGIIAEHRVSAG